MALGESTRSIGQLGKISSWNSRLTRGVRLSNIAVAFYQYSGRVRFGAIEECMNTSNRREFLAGTCAFAAASALKVAAQPNRRPNILVILADEMSIDALSATIGKKYVDTPNLDKLRAKSMYFSRAYVANPLCVPSRTAMFTGRSRSRRVSRRMTRLRLTRYISMHRLFI